MKKLPLIFAALLFAGVGLAQGARTYTFTDAEKKARDAQLGDEAAQCAKNGQSRYSFWPFAMNVTASASQPPKLCIDCWGE